jgi:xylose isomerase
MEVVRDVGLKVGMCTANLFRRPEFTSGNFGNTDPKIRAAAVRYTQEYIAAGIEVFESETYVYWNGSNGIDVPLAANYPGLYENTAMCLAEVVGWMLKAYGPKRAIPICIEPKPNEPRGYGVPADVGEALALIAMIPEELRDFVALNVEACHSMIGGKRYAMELGLALAANKLFHTHLNGGSGFKFDEDRTFGDIDFSVAVETMAVLLEHNRNPSGRLAYNGLLGLDVQPLATDTNSQQAASIERGIRNLKRSLICAERLNWPALNKARSRNDQATVSDLFARAVCGLA